MVTPSAIHWRNGGEGAKFIAIESIKDVTIQESSSILKLAELKINEERIEINGPTTKARNEIAQQISKIIEANKARHSNRH